MTRDTVINVLLIIAGIVLAIALFGAGVFWKGKAAKPIDPMVSGRRGTFATLAGGRVEGVYPANHHV